jgi:hypothetical protein
MPLCSSFTTVTATGIFQLFPFQATLPAAALICGAVPSILAVCTTDVETLPTLSFAEKVSLKLPLGSPGRVKAVKTPVEAL